MKKLSISKEHRALIESVVRESIKFRGNEELIDIFVDSVYKKSYLLMDTIRDKDRLKKHLFAICDSCMESVLKEKQKFSQTQIYRQIEKNNKLQDEIVTLKPSVLDEEDRLAQEYEMEKTRRNIVNLKEEIQRSERYDTVDGLIDPLEFCPAKRISENTMEKLVKMIKILDSKYPNKKYYEIFSLRYIKRFKQADIARQLTISQMELSKRFVEMIKLAKDNL